METLLVELGGGQESKGGVWKADAIGTNVKGGRKREGGEQEKGQEEDGDHPRGVENNREIIESPKCKSTQRPPQASASDLEAAERSGHTQTSL